MPKEYWAKLSDKARQLWDQLDDSSRAALAEQIQAIDFDQIEQALKQHSESQDWAAIAARSSSPPAIRLTANDQSKRQLACAAGEQALRAGKVGESSARRNRRL